MTGDLPVHAETDRIGLMSNSKTKTVLVVGDIVVDHHIYEGERLRLLDDKSRGVHVVEELGGAALTARLIQALFERERPEAEARWEARLGYDISEASGAASHVPNELHSYAMWKLFPLEGTTETVWRVGRALGYGTPRSDPGSLPWRASNRAAPDILVLDDAGAGFRHVRERDHWNLTTDPAPTWIVLKLAGAPGTGDLWSKIGELKMDDRLIIVVAAPTLRQMEAQLNPGLSWEQAAEQLARELAFNPSLRPLRGCRHLFVSFGHEGVVWIDFSGGAPKGRLVFDSAHVEGEWSSDIRGEALGAHVCLASAIVKALALACDPQDLDLGPALEAGLCGMRRLRGRGHGVAAEEGSASGFPTADIAAEISRPGTTFAHALVPWPTGGSSDSPPTWSILTASQGAAATSRPLFGFARQIALRGDAALKGVPYLRIGRLLTPSREEMEALRILKKTMREYRESDPRKPKPLSIGVFGAPGAGKSFSVRELASGVFGDASYDDYEGWMEFNLAQFNNTGDLIGALHQVRDRVLEGLIPVVFWDEFDSREYHWLQYLLAPMQDGKFQEGQITHPIGKCVFIFAGATAASFAQCGESRDLTESELIKAKRDFVLAKGADFKSRLDASLDVLGPNPKEAAAPEGKTASPFAADSFCPIRRAIFVRAQLGVKPNEKLDIDSGLLTALLEIPKFNHGSRSLEKLLAPLRAARKEGLPVRRSQLASPRHLAMYVDPDRFYELCRRHDSFRQDDIVREIAPAIHETWREIARTQGWPSKYDMAYAELPPAIKRSNEAAARRMPDVLALVGTTAGAWNQRPRRGQGEGTSDGASRPVGGGGARRLDGTSEVGGLGVRDGPQR